MKEALASRYLPYFHRKARHASEIKHSYGALYTLNTAILLDYVSRYQRDRIYYNSGNTTNHNQDGRLGPTSIMVVHTDPQHKTLNGLFASQESPSVSG